MAQCLCSGLSRSILLCVRAITGRRESQKSPSGPCRGRARSLLPMNPGPLQSTPFPSLPHDANAKADAIHAQSLQCPRTSASQTFAPMHSAVSLISKYVLEHNHLTIPLLLNILAATSHVYSPIQHSLLVTGISWLLLYFLVTARTGVFSITNGRQRQTAWLAGASVALSLICERAACDKAGIWATKVTSCQHIKRTATL